MIEQMERSIEEHFTSPEQMKEYLDFLGKFYDYSVRNVSLIKGQFPGAEAVGSFKFWKDKGFSVNKGEKGIKVLVPTKRVDRFKDKEGNLKSVNQATEKEKQKIELGKVEVEKGKLYFSIGHVFDVSQTNAKASDLPELFPNRWLEGNVENYDRVMKSLINISENMGVPVREPFEELGLSKGAYYHGVSSLSNGFIVLNPRNSELQNVKTLIHEMAHAKLHHKDSENHYKLSDAEKEFQAEMVAYTTAKYFGIDTNEYSLKYLANWTKDKKLNDKAKLLNEIKTTSTEFIKQLEDELPLNKYVNEKQVQNSVKCNRKILQLER